MTETTMTQTLEDRGLQSVKLFLKRRRFEILEEKWSCDAGCIDLIAKDDDSLVL